MLRQSHQQMLYLFAGVASITLLKFLHTSRVSSVARKPPSNITPPPCESNPYLKNPSVAKHLPYPPISTPALNIPGARDVATPFGTIRVYEFGSEAAARKILFLHGISTPCISLYPIASHLASEHQCRVMLMDLFGRGWSGGPSDLPYDNRLYTSQILAALTSSPISWTTGDGFSLVGYSLGGALAADFTSWFPSLVQDLCLLAPGGILRESNISWKSRVLYSRGWLPESFLRWLVRRRLCVEPKVNAMKEGQGGSGSVTGDSVESGNAAAAEVPERDASKGIDIEGAVQWQLENHDGFVPAYMSSIRYAPVYHGHDRWALIGSRLQAQKRAENQAEVKRKDGLKDGAARAEDAVLRNGLQSGKVLLVLGGKDKIVKVEEVGSDAAGLMGQGNIEVKVYEDAGHEVPIKHAVNVADTIRKSWNDF